MSRRMGDAGAGAAPEQIRRGIAVAGARMTHTRDPLRAQRAGARAVFNDKRVADGITQDRPSLALGRDGAKYGPRPRSDQEYPGLAWSPTPLSSSLIVTPTDRAAIPVAARATADRPSARRRPARHVAQARPARPAGRPPATDSRSVFWRPRVRRRKDRRRKWVTAWRAACAENMKERLTCRTQAKSWRGGRAASRSRVSRTNAVASPPRPDRHGTSARTPPPLPA